MSKARWWTCGCGWKNCSQGPGRPVCESCGKPATFAIAAPKGHAGFDFTVEVKRDE